MMSQSGKSNRVRNMDLFLAIGHLTIIVQRNIRKISLTSCVSGGNFTKILYIFVRYTTKTQHGPAKN